MSELGEMLDTSPEQRRRYYDLLRAMTVEQRAQKLTGLCRLARELAAAGVRARHPDASEADFARLLASRLYGPAAARLRRP